MYVYAVLGVVVSVVLNAGVFGRMGGDGKRGEVGPLAWNRAPPAPLTHRNKGDVGDIDPRGSVRYNMGHNGRILRGIITRHREVPVDDEGTGLEQAKG